MRESSSVGEGVCDSIGMMQSLLASATHCNTLANTATHCNTQLSVLCCYCRCTLCNTHCNTIQGGYSSLPFHT